MEIDIEPIDLSRSYASRGGIITVRVLSSALPGVRRVTRDGAGMDMGQDVSGVSIRVAVAEDAPSIASVLRESFVEYEPLYTREGFAATTPASAQVRERIEEGPVWVVSVDGAVVGTVSAVPKGESLYVRGMAIVPAARGRGIGELLLREVEAYASERGFKRLLLSTTPFLGRAIQLYERYGFRRSGEGPDELFGTPLFTMEKILKSPVEHEGER